jgi:hypothetical protein
MAGKKRAALKATGETLAKRVKTLAVVVEDNDNDDSEVAPAVDEEGSGEDEDEEVETPSKPKKKVKAKKPASKSLAKDDTLSCSNKGCIVSKS